jgi:hypothetical protein
VAALKEFESVAKITQIHAQTVRCYVECGETELSSDARARHACWRLQQLRQRRAHAVRSASAGAAACVVSRQVRLSSRRDLARSSAPSAVGTSGGRLGGATAHPAGGAELSGHPFFRTECALQQRRQIKMCIELREMDAETGRADVDFGKVGWHGPFQPLRNVRRERQFQAVVQGHDDAAAPPVIARGNCNRFGRPALGSASGCSSEFIALRYESFSIPRRGSRVGC